MENFVQNAAYYTYGMENVPTLIHVNANHNNFRGCSAWTSHVEPNYTVPFVINYHRQTPPEDFQPIPTKTYVNPLMLPSKTVLVNPHFKRNVHVNPHFNKPSADVEPTSTLSKAPAIHVNPKALEKIRTVEKSKPTETDVAVKTPAAGNFETGFRRSKRRISIRTKYKIVRSGTVVRSPVLRSTYKIDRRNAPLKKSSPLRTVPKKRIVHRRYVRAVSGVSAVRRKFSYIVKYEPAKLYRTYKKPSSSNLKTVRCLYAVDRRRKYIRKSISDDKSSQTPRRRTKSVLSTARRLITNSSRKLVIKRVVKPRKETRKDNTLCPYYRKYGSCRGKEKGTCHKLHDRKHITVCRKFLKGACDSKNCRLSHDVSLKKMPTCKFFLEGFCGKDNCPYLHVKLNPKAEICKAFLQGYCDAAERCDKRHVSIRPVYDKEGACDERKRPRPHAARPVENASTVATGSKPEASDVKAKSIEAAAVKERDKGKEQSGPVLPSRYHTVTEDDGGEKNRTRFTKTKLPETLPDFIPLD